MALFDLDPLLNAMLDTAPGISDLNLSVGRPPQVEIDGALRPISYAGLTKLMPYHTELIAMRLLGGKRDVTAWPSAPASASTSSPSAAATAWCCA
jgi:twitching motility protein PilT